MPDDKENFLSRWSQRKVEAARQKASGEEEAKGAAPRDVPQFRSDGAGAGERRSEVDAALAGAADDAARSLLGGKPVLPAKDALRQLWASDPVLSRSDGLLDYAGDFTDGALAVPAGALMTAFDAGLGCMTDSGSASAAALAGPRLAGRVTDIAFLGPGEGVPGVALHWKCIAGTRAQAKRMVVGRDEVLAMARSGTEIIGCAVLARTGDTADIARILFPHRTRVRGIARLLTALERRAESWGARALRIEITDRRPALVRLCHRLGLSEEPDALASGTVRLRKSLRPS